LPLISAFSVFGIGSVVQPGRLAANQSEQEGTCSWIFQSLPMGRPTYAWIIARTPYFTQPGSATRRLIDSNAARSIGRGGVTLFGTALTSWRGATRLDLGAIVPGAALPPSVQVRTPAVFQRAMQSSFVNRWDVFGDMLPVGHASLQDGLASWMAWGFPYIFLHLTGF